MSHLSKRRILNLRAIRPCDDISPLILVDSLIILAREIFSRRSESFPIHRRCIREAIREVGVLLQFFEDIRDRQCPLSESSVVSLFELHVTLQKMNQVVQDCSRRDARIWILMRSDWVLSDLRVLVRSIATALDVLPLDEIDAGVEIKEVVQLLKRQAWNVEIGIDCKDDWAARSVKSILFQFKNGVAPDEGHLRRILDHLDIRTWCDCNKESSFLEKELTECENDEVALLGGLIAFMAYCRAVLFDTVFDGEYREEQRKCSSPTSVGGRLDLECLRCPISLEVMTDPVTISTGQTYDRGSIEKWILKGGGTITCPVTGEKLTTTELIPNSAVRNLVKQFTNIPVSKPSVKSRRSLNDIVSPLSAAQAGGIRLTVASLINKISRGTMEEKKISSYEIRRLAKSTPFNRFCLLEADAVPWLLSLLSSSDLRMQVNAFTALVFISRHQSGRRALFEANGFGLILDAVKVGLIPRAQESAASIFFYLSLVEEYRKEMGDIPEAIPTLVELLKDGNCQVNRCAVGALYELLRYPGNHPRVVASGAVPALVRILSRDEGDLVRDAIALLEKIAARDEGTTAILRSSAIAELVGVLNSPISQLGKELCVSLLLLLCNNGGDKVVSLLVNAPALMSSLYSIVTEGSPKAGKKATLLLNRLIHYRDQNYSPHLATPPSAVAARDHFVRAQ
ncbi:U-box domain-containing protein 18-like [Typha latifolia]|uniref:U-box domain-containing protein 18-like n=1 Tax=Typha latifolia TaxID=4733 RepID=UPI003C2FA69B